MKVPGFAILFCVSLAPSQVNGFHGTSQAFVPRAVTQRRRTTAVEPPATQSAIRPQTRSATALQMAMDPVTYLRTEWISAALVTNQTPRAADVCLQLGTQDGRAVTFVPRTIREFITSTVEPSGELDVRIRRQLQQSEDRRQAAKVVYCEQPADDLRETKDESVDVVISLQAVEAMKENGMDWKKTVREAARVLKPGGRLLWVEPTEIDGESYGDYVESLIDVDDESVLENIEDDEELEKYLVFDDIGYDDIDFILQPHVAGLAIKSMDAGMTVEERESKAKMEEQEKLAEISLQAYERGIKKKKRKKKKKGLAEETAQ
eukprot:CAMPEP_0172439276 /NCGR_PEP_ID=MMETSP1065-20121228/318_1 /TAXON_ID=265537 /ORGANISM="Amphiprora paludosa, Strain CCMP125" /LENGTH=318 /DNA_ID=CAMNT_0013187931 /DNA_START=16 /DNA_END=972 /DNA_ORIENTATION=+